MYRKRVMDSTRALKGMNECWWMERVKRGRGRGRGRGRRRRRRGSGKIKRTTGERVVVVVEPPLGIDRDYYQDCNLYLLSTTFTSGYFFSTFSLTPEVKKKLCPSPYYKTINSLSSSLYYCSLSLSLTHCYHQ